MAEIIDLLATAHDGGAEFTVDTTGPLSVDLVPVNPAIHKLYAGGGTSQFKRGDSFTILSVGFFIPENFVMYNYENVFAETISVPVILLQGVKLLGGAISIFNFGSNGLFRMPFHNYEYSVGTFTDPEENNLIEEFSLQTLFPFTSGLDRPQISMVNVPAVLNGVTIKVTPFIKVLHNFVLT